MPIVAIYLRLFISPSGSDPSTSIDLPTMDANANANALGMDAVTNETVDLVRTPLFRFHSFNSFFQCSNLIYY
jgi:hypothetical protein